MTQMVAVIPARKVSWLAIDAVGLRATRQMTAAVVSMMVMMASVELIGGLEMIPTSWEVTVA